MEKRECVIWYKIDETLYLKLPTIRWFGKLLPIPPSDLQEALKRRGEFKLYGEIAVLERSNYKIDEIIGEPLKTERTIYYFRPWKEMGKKEREEFKERVETLAIVRKVKKSVSQLSK